jgi:uncharacterized protein YheU (UPF0270 family)
MSGWALFYGWFVIKIPPQQLSNDALTGVIDAFVLREGTDYGHRDIPIEEKRDRVRKMLASGRAEIHYYPENEHIDIELIG